MWFPSHHRFTRFTGYIAMMASIVSAVSCMKKEQYPIIPEIRYESFIAEYDTNPYPSRGYLTISFKDGDGDIGLRSTENDPPYDSAGPYYFNYVISYFEKRNGVFTEVTLTPSLSARIPLLTPDEPNRAIKGIIVDTLPLNPAPQYDTIMLKFFIYDRALHKSNVDSTPSIILRRR
jgi:hypothetical protein